jgi:hypothetical protein
MGVDLDKMNSDPEGFSAGIKKQMVTVATQKVRGVLAKTSLGPIVSQLNLDPEMIARLISGDMTAVLDIARQWGVDEGIMKVIVAISRKDFEKMTEGVCDIVSNAGVAIDKELATLVLNMARQQVRVHSSSQQHQPIIHSFGNMHANVHQTYICRHIHTYITHMHTIPPLHRPAPATKKAESSPSRSAWWSKRCSTTS